MAKRKRASRGSLTSEAISAAALEIADELGLENLTVRKLADKLGVAPMSVYGYYKNKDEIVGSLLARVIEAFFVTDHDTLKGEPWILESFKRMRRALLAHPGVIPLLGTQASVSPSSLHVMTRFGEVFTELGLNAEESAARFYALLTFTIGTAHVENGFRRIMTTTTAANLSKALPSGASDALLQTAPHLLGQATEEAFEQTLKRLLA
ncbi:MAG: TetR family transcriptional regulator [Deltaproteobacteria bacterium]|nr:TetR family transcriptional regulator [Deltaproteobacteria bacterium]